MAFRFRVCFCTVGEGGITSDAEHVEFTSTVLGLPLKFSSGSKGVPIGKNERFSVSGGPFETLEKAVAVAQKVWTALLYKSVVTQRGIDLGQHAQHSFDISPHGKQLFAKQLDVERIEPDHLGITIYTDDPAPTFVRMNMRGVVSTPAQAWVEKLAASIGRVEFKGPAAETASEIYAISHFVGRAHARFLLLFVSLEALFKPQLRSDKAVSLVTSMIQEIHDSDLDENEKTAIASQLSFLRNASIAQTGRDLATARLGGKTYLEKSPADFFRYAYKIRNDIVHSAAIDPTALGNLLGEMDRFVSDILVTEYVEP